MRNTYWGIVEKKVEIGCRFRYTESNESNILLLYVEK